MTAHRSRTHAPAATTAASRPCASYPAGSMSQARAGASTVPSPTDSSIPATGSYALAPRTGGFSAVAGGTRTLAPASSITRASPFIAASNKPSRW